MLANSSPIVLDVFAVPPSTHWPTWLGPVVKACVGVERAEWLRAEQAVALQMLAHVLQEPQHRRRTGGGGKLHVANTMLWPHCGGTAQTAFSLCVPSHARAHRHTRTHTHTVCIQSLKKPADGLGLPPSLYKHFFALSHLTLHPPLPPSTPHTQAKPAQIHKLKPPSTPKLTNSLPNPGPQGRPNPSIPNQVRRTCHFWLQTQCSHQLLPQALSFIPPLFPLSNTQAHTHTCMTHECVLKPISPGWLPIQAV